MANFEEQIQDYLDGNLSADEQNEFELAMASDKDLADNVALRTMIMNAIEKDINTAEEVSNLKAILSSKRTYFTATNEVNTTAKKIKFSSWKWVMAAAASITLMVTIIGFYNRTDFDALPPMEKNIVRSNSQNNEYNEAVATFNNKNYDKSIALLNALNEKDSNNATVNYYLGLSYMADKQYKNAISTLKITAEGQSIYKEDAAYYLGYSYYKLENYNQAKTYLSRVSSTNELYKKAQKLMRKMK